MKSPFIIFGLVLAFLTVFAAPYRGQVKRFKQPDGTWVDIKLYGSEYYMRGEGLDYPESVQASDRWQSFASDGKQVLEPRSDSCIQPCNESDEALRRG